MKTVQEKRREWLRLDKLVNEYCDHCERCMKEDNLVGSEFWLILADLTNAEKLLV